MKKKTFDDEILNVIGKLYAEERVIVPAIHTTFLVRWLDIHKEGLSEKKRTKLIKKYPLSSKYFLIDSPELNFKNKTSLQQKNQFC